MDLVELRSQLTRAIVESTVCHAINTNTDDNNAQSKVDAVPAASSESPNQCRHALLSLLQEVIARMLSANTELSLQEQELVRIVVGNIQQVGY